MSFPLSNDDEAQADFVALLKSCEAATFGRGQEEILDEEYRKASKMDVSNFSTDFNPYEYRIIDIVLQAMGPGHGKHMSGIRAELYKLNVCRV